VSILSLLREGSLFQFKCRMANAESTLEPVRGVAAPSSLLESATLAMPVTLTRGMARSHKALRSLVGRQTQSGERASCELPVPPHPGPLPKGEGDRYPVSQRPATLRDHTSAGDGAPSPRGREFAQCRYLRFEPRNRTGRTSNSQPPTSNNQCLPIARSMDVGRWMLAVGCSQGSWGGRGEE
jgi:hypothetical protein